MRVYERSASPITLDRDGIAQSQTPAGAGALTLNGAGIANGFATLAPPRQVSVFSGSNIAARVFTVTGTDRAGSVITDTITGINNTTVSTNKIFRTVTSVTVDAGTGAAVEAGWTALSYTSWIILGNYRGNYTSRIVAVVSGTVNFDVEVTSQNMWRDGVSGDYPDDIKKLQTGQTARTDDVLTAPYAAVRLLLNSGTGSVKLRVLPSATV